MPFSRSRSFLSHHAYPFPATKRRSIFHTSGYMEPNLIGQSDLDSFRVPTRGPTSCCAVKLMAARRESCISSIYHLPLDLVPHDIPISTIHADLLAPCLPACVSAEAKLWPGERTNRKRGELLGERQREYLLQGAEFGGRKPKQRLEIDTQRLAASISQEMDREEMKMVILGQEQTFRQQVHEMHRIYHVQKQLMREMQMAGQNQAHPEMKPKLEVWRDDKAANRQQLYSLSNSRTPAPAAEECDLELTLATGSSRSHKGKQVGRSSNSDSGMAVSSTSTESDLAQFKEFDARAVRFRTESRRFTVADETNQFPPWLHQPVILRVAR